MDMGISGLRVLVTAGAGGIGLKVTEAFLAEGEESNSAWVRYRALTKDRQVWAELDHNRQMQLIEKGPQKAVGPYEYSPAVMEKIKKKVKEKMKS